MEDVAHHGTDSVLDRLLVQLHKGFFISGIPFTAEDGLLR